MNHNATSTIANINDTSVKEVAFVSTPKFDLDLKAPTKSSTIIYEAEDMALDTYEVENNADASGGKLIWLNQAQDGTVGTASQVFDGAKGVYDIQVKYMDENDGESTLEIKHNDNSLANWTLDQDLGAGGASYITLTSRTINGVQLDTGDTLSITGTKNVWENARVDYVKFTPVASQGAYKFTYHYGNGEYYTGYGYTNHDEEFSVGQKIEESGTNETGYKGYYEIHSINPNPSHGGSPLDWQKYAGDVVVDGYYDFDSNKKADFNPSGGEPGHFHDIQAGSDGLAGSLNYGTGDSGLGSERGLIHLDGHPGGFTQGMDSIAYFDNANHADLA